MAEQPVDLTHELLPQIRAEQAQFRTEMAEFRETIGRRFDRVESDMLEVKQTLRGVAYMLVSLTGRVGDLETRVDRLTPA